MFIELASAAFLVGRFVYHRMASWIPERREPQSRQISLPRTEEGAPIPLIYGRCRVRNPILAWREDPVFAGTSFIVDTFQVNMFFVVGVPFQSGAGTTRIHSVWSGDTKLDRSLLGAEPTGDGGFEASVVYDNDGADGVYIGGAMEYLNGKATQTLVDDSGTATTTVGQRMSNTGTPTLDDVLIPGYRGYLSAFLFKSSATDQMWSVGDGGSVPAISIEASSYPTGTAQLNVGQDGIADDANPACVIWDLFTDPMKRGLPEILFDRPSFEAAAYTLRNEGLGFSLSVEEEMTAEELIQLVLEHIDGAIDINPTTNKVVLKLVRPDFDPSTIPQIDKSNCYQITGFAAGGWSDIANAVRVRYRNRARDYEEDSELSTNQGNAVDQEHSDELLLDYPGVTTSTLAILFANREIGARCRPLMKCTAIVDRTFINVMRGDAVRLVWSRPGIASVIFRVADVDRGTLSDGKISLALIQDFFFTHGNSTPQPLPDTDIGEISIVMG